MHKVLYVLSLIWQLPQLIVGLVMMPFLGKLELVATTPWSRCYKGSKMKGGISLGPLCFVSEGLSTREASVRHEVYGHTYDSRLFGPMYLIIIGLPSLLNAWIGFTKCYYDFYTERRANRNAGLKVDNRCCLIIEGEPK